MGRSWALEAQKMGYTPFFSSSRRKSTSNMAEAAKAKYAKDDIVLVPFPASFELKSDFSKGNILSVKAVKSSGVGFVYKVQLPEETGDAFGQQSV
jgi:hypothetical protein